MGVGEVLLGLPTGIFTIALAFCLSWWISSFVLGGIDSGPDSSPVGKAGGRAGGRTAPAATLQAGGKVKTSGRNRLTRANSTNPAVPASLRWTVSTGIAWSVSLIGSLVVEAVDPVRRIRLALLVAVGLGALVIGRAAGQRFSHLVAPIFVTPEAPERLALVGSHARVRSLEISADAGEAKLLDGKSPGAIVRVRSELNQRAFNQGDIVQLISYDEDSGTYRIDVAEAELLDERHLPPSPALPSPPSSTPLR